MAERNHILRLTIEFEAGCTPEAAKDITAAVLAKIERCWADTSSGPVHDNDGRHVANALLEKLPIGMQLANQLRGTAQILEEHRQLHELVQALGSSETGQVQ